MPQEMAYVNGNLVELKDAHINALDRGFIYGDGLYEVVAVYNGKLYQMDEHLERFQEGATEMLFENHPTSEELKEIAEELVESSKIKDGIVYLQVTRGVAPRMHSFPENPSPGVFMFVKPFSFPDTDKKFQGVKAILVPDERWNRCHVKSVNLLPNCFYKEQAKRRGAYEAIQVHPEVGVTEGTSCNVFGVKDGVVYTAPLGNRILRGITRCTVVDLAHEKGMTVKEEFMSASQLYRCHEVFLTSTTSQLLPVRQVDRVEYPVSRYQFTFTLQGALQQHIIENL